MPTTLAGIAKLRSFSSIRLVFAAWSSPMRRAARPGAARGARSRAASSRSPGAIRARSGCPPSAAAATRRARGPSRPAAAGAPASRRRRRPVQTVWLIGDGARPAAPAGRGCSRRPAGRRPGGSGRRPARVGHGRSPPRPWLRRPARPVGRDDAGVAGRRPAASRPRPSCRPSGRSPVTGSGQLREPQVEGEHQPGSPRSPRQTTNAPGPVSSGSRSVSARNRPMRPPPRSVPKRVERRAPRTPRASRRRPGRRPTRVAPQPGVRPLAGTPLHVPAGAEEEERQQPASGLEPRRDRVAPPVGQRALARQGERDQRDRAERRAQRSRRSSGRRPALTGREPGELRTPATVRRRSGGARRVGGRGRRSAGSPPLRPPPRPGRPSAGAWSARTGSATRRP